MQRNRRMAHLALALGVLASAIPAVTTAAPAIRHFETDSLARIVAAQRGKPFVLMVWSLDCTYCQASLATLAKEKRVRKNLEVVTLATDSAADQQNTAMIAQKLHASGLTSDAWGFGAAPPEQLRYAIDPRWHGEVPRSYWFNARGEKIGHSGLITPAVVDRLVPPLTSVSP